MSGLELYAGAHTRDADLLELLQTPPQSPLPERLQARYDPLGLVGHEHVHQAAAEQVYGAFSHIAETIASNNPEVRDALVGDDCVELPKVRLGQFNVYGLRRTAVQETGTVFYEFYRDDIGNPDGGFYVVRKPSGSVILTRCEPQETAGQCEADLEESAPGYADLIHAATAAAVMYAAKTNVPLGSLSDKVDEEHLSDDRIAEFAKEVKRENSLLYKTKRRLGKLASAPVVSVKNVFTVPDPEEVKLGIEDPARIPHKRRIIAAAALTACLVPIPGYSPNMHTPASVVAVGDVKDVLSGAFTDAETPPPAPVADPNAAYDARHLDLDSSFDLEVGSTVPVPLITGDVPNAVLQAPIIQAGEFGGGGELAADSPRRVSIKENIAPNQCARIPIAESVQGQTLSFGTLEPAVSRDLTVETSLTALTVCNESDEIVPSGVLSSFVFDVRS